MAVIERQPKDCEEAGRVACKYLQARSMSIGQGTINGIYCTDILVDTGATQTLVHKDLVTDDDILDGEVTIGCAHGDTSSYPLAAININIGGKDIITTPVYLAPSPHWLVSDGTSPSSWTSSPTDGTSKTARTRWQL